MSKSVGGTILSLAVAAAGVKLLMFMADGYVKSADPSGAFYGTIASFTGLGDLLFLGLAGLAILLVPYWVYKHNSQGKK